MIRRQFHFRPIVPIPRWCGGLRNAGPCSRICRGNLAGCATPGLPSEGGSTLVEFALASVIFFSMLVGVFELSLAFYTYHYVSYAARQGSRYAIVRGAMCSVHFPNAPADFHCDAQESDIANYVKTLGYPGIRPDHNKMVVTVSTCESHTTTDLNDHSTTTWDPPIEGTSHNMPGDQVQVSVEYDFPLSIPFWKQVTIPVYSTSNMVYSQ